MSLHTITPGTVTDPHARSPRSLARELAGADQDLAAARADLRRLTRGRGPRAAHRAERAGAAVAHAEVEVDRLVRAIRTAGGHVSHDAQGQRRIRDRRGRLITA